MPAERVVDASVVAAAFFDEVATPRAQAALRRNNRLVAPDLLLVEMASIASSKVRRQLSTSTLAEQVLVQANGLVAEFVPSNDHYRRAFSLAAEHGVSAYDGLYLALAEARGVPMITADEKLIRRANACGLSALVESI